MFRSVARRIRPQKTRFQELQALQLRYDEIVQENTRLKTVIAAQCPPQCGHLRRGFRPKARNDQPTFSPHGVKSVPGNRAVTHAVSCSSQTKFSPQSQDQPRHYHNQPPKAGLDPSRIPNRQRPVTPRLAINTM